MADYGFSLNLLDYHYHLPPEHIAQRPAVERDQSRLMVLDRTSGSVFSSRFRELAEWLPERGLLVVNDTRVTPARLYGRRPTCGKVEILILQPPPADAPAGVYDLECLTRPSRFLRVGAKVTIGPDLEALVVAQGSGGHRTIRLDFQRSPHEVLARIGQMPLPPYIKRPGISDDTENGHLDRDRYQTIYARDPGAVAAPTAGLHFTPYVFETLKGRGIEVAAVTLHVGYGTFAPLMVENLRSGRLHPEKVIIPEETTRRINQAKAQGRPIIAVGTTVVRAMESAVVYGAIPSGNWWTDLFIRPGFKFQIVDHLVTNFHLPQSSLLMLVAAFAGREAVLSAYRQAVTEGYRFFSYGDAMLIR